MTVDDKIRQLQAQVDDLMAEMEDLTLAQAQAFEDEQPRLSIHRSHLQLVDSQMDTQQSLSLEVDSTSRERRIYDFYNPSETAITAANMGTGSDEYLLLARKNVSGGVPTVFYVSLSELGADELVGVSATGTPGYIGEDNTRGVVRAGSYLTKTVDGAGHNYVTFDFDVTAIDDTLANAVIAAVSDWSGVDLSGASWTSSPWEGAGAIDHGDLAGLDDDDHDGPTYPYFLLGEAGGAAKANWYARNTLGTEDNYCGRSLHIETALYVNDIYDEGTSGPIIDVQNMALEHGGTECLNWDTTSVDIISGRKFKVLDTTPSTENDTGAAQCKGGINAQAQSRFDDGTYVCDFLSGAVAAQFSDGSDLVAAICTGNGKAGYFADASRTCELCNGTYSVNASGDINTGSYYKVGTTQVVASQQAAVADATGAGDVVAQLNALLARLRTHGLIAT